MDIAMNHPAMKARSSSKTMAEVTGADYSTRAGAQYLANEINRAWADCGCHIQTRIEQVNGAFCVRSNLINGLPPKLSLV